MGRRSISRAFIYFSLFYFMVLVPGVCDEFILTLGMPLYRVT